MRRAVLARRSGRSAVGGRLARAACVSKFELVSTQTRGPRRGTGSRDDQVNEAGRGKPARLMLAARSSEAQYAAQLYPYCSLSPSSGATNCYIRSREECGSSCISNPWYIGQQRALPYLEGRTPLEPHYVRP